MFLRKMFIAGLVLITGFLSGEIMTIRLISSPVIFENNTPAIYGFNKLQVPGTPILPAKSIVLALPSGARVNFIDVQYDDPELLEARTMSIAPPHLPLCLDEQMTYKALARWQCNKDRIESSEGIFPTQPVYYSKMSFFRNIPFIKISYFPLLYSRYQLFHYRTANITIHYTKKHIDNSIPDWAYKNASQIFSNWDEIRGYYNIDARDDSFDYVILTRDNLFTAFDSLVNWKNSIGFHTKLVSIDSVVAQYPGIETADKIRNFLIDKYDSWGIHYLLIGGNIDIIPMKICFPDPGHNYDTPTDYYFAELTDNWDADGDGFYGEYEEDSINFVPEVIVGRFPYNDTETLGSIVEKTVHFEMDTGTWKNRALLLAAFNNFENENNSGWPDCDGAVLMENMKDSLLSGWIYTRLYEEAGLCPSIYPHEQALTQSNVVAEWSTGNYAITNWSGHGSPSGAYRKYWAWDDGDSIPESYEIEWATFIHRSDVQSLDDSHPSIVFSASCSNAATEDNLARDLIANGAAGIVAATSYGWYTPGWEDPSDGNIMSLDYYFYYYLIGENEKVGDALFNAKVYYFNYLYFPDPWAGDPEWTPQQNMLDYTLFGDPSLVREGVGVAEIISDETNICNICFYPNPVHAQGSFEYSLPCDGEVVITVFNIIGQKISTLHRAKERAGCHAVPFAKNSLPSGVYILRMEFNGQDSKKTVKQKVIVF